MNDKEHQQKCLLFVVGMMEQLKGEGLIEGGYEMSDKGRRQYRALIDSGFRPSDQEIDDWTKFVFHSAGTEMAQKALEGEMPS